jgi:hypothetical protein
MTYMRTQFLPENCFLLCSTFHPSITSLSFKFVGRAQILFNYVAVISFFLASFIHNKQHFSNLYQNSLCMHNGEA